MPKKINPSSLGLVIALGSIWGLSEAGLGMALRNCASFVSGSIMTGIALFFISAVWKRNPQVLGPVLLVVIASVFKMFDAFLLSLPIRHGAVANPIFAFLTEVLAFIIIVSFARENLTQKRGGQALLGALAALLAVNLFPLVRFITGIPACVVPGTSVPLSLYYAPVAVGISLITVPFGFWVGEKVKALESTGSSIRRLVFDRWIAPTAVILSLVLMMAIRLP
ncbi:MAG: hypothetical protein WCC06_11075 [Candidatus Aminicenantales bacterium]